jgi:hypothetical protein
MTSIPCHIPQISLQDIFIGQPLRTYPFSLALNRLSSLNHLEDSASGIT